MRQIKYSRKDWENEKEEPWEIMGKEELPYDKYGDVKTEYLYVTKERRDFDLYDD